MILKYVWLSVLIGSTLWIGSYSECTAQRCSRVCGEPVWPRSGCRSSIYRGSCCRARWLPTALFERVGSGCRHRGHIISPGVVNSPPNSQDGIARKRMFDGKTLAGWEKSKFGGEGEVEVVDSQIIIHMGHGLTGIHWQGDQVPVNDYTLKVKAKRLEGEDMVCGLTFPVGEQFCSLIVGGWGGSLVGISSIDGKDASDNETTRVLKLEHHRWYQISINVANSRIVCKIDDEEVVNISTLGKKLSLRADCELAKPIGVFSFGTKIAIQHVDLIEQNPTPTTEDDSSPK